LRRQLSSGLLVAISAVTPSFVLDGAGLYATPDAQRDQLSNRVPSVQQVRPPSLESLDQVGLTAELTRRVIRADNPQTPEKMPSGRNCFRRRCRLAVKARAGS
jgi:hypothetical protein